MLSKIFYVYVYLDPRKLGTFSYGKYVFDHEPFYIGKGYNSRFLDHVSLHGLKSKNRLKANKIKKIFSETSQQPIIIKYKENLIEKDALDIEKNMIQTIGRIDLKTGPLTNLTNGGEGLSGFIYSDELKKKRSQAMKGNKHTLGHILSEEHRNKISKSISKRYLDGIPHSFLGKHHTKKMKEYISKRQLGKKRGKYKKEI